LHTLTLFAHLSTLASLYTPRLITQPDTLFAYPSSARLFARPVTLLHTPHIIVLTLSLQVAEMTLARLLRAAPCVGLLGQGRVLLTGTRCWRRAAHTGQGEEGAVRPSKTRSRTGNLNAVQEKIDQIMANVRLTLPSILKYTLNPLGALSSVFTVCLSVLPACTLEHSVRVSVAWWWYH
jgi:hypothetical protein